MMSRTITDRISRHQGDKTTEAVRFDPEALQQIRQLIRSGEGERIEFKAKANHPDKIARSLVSFANSSGGVLLLGVHDDGSIKGIRFPEEDVTAISRILKTARPGFRWRYRIVAVSARQWVVRFEVSEARRKPVILRMDAAAVFIRVGDQSLQAGLVTAEVLRRRTSASGSLIRYDAQEESLLEVLRSEPVGISFQRLQQRTRLGKKILCERLAGLAVTGVVRIRHIAGEEIFQSNS